MCACGHRIDPPRNDNREQVERARTSKVSVRVRSSHIVPLLELIHGSGEERLIIR